MEKEKQKRVPMSEATKEKIRQAKLNKNKEQDVDFKEVKQGELITGFGDVIAKVTKMFGIEPCDACIKRRDEINSWSVMTIVSTPTYDDIDLMASVHSTKVLKSEDKQKFFEMYGRIFGKKIKPCNCPGVVLSMVQNFDKHFKLDYETH